MLKKGKGQWKTPTETSVQFKSFLNSDASWMRIPYNPERYKTIDSMRTTYIDSAKYHGIGDKVFVKILGDSIVLMKKRKNSKTNAELNDVLTKFIKDNILDLIAR